MDHEEKHRRAFSATVQSHRADRAVERVQSASTNLKNERVIRRLLDDLESTRREIASVKIQFEILVRDHKSMLRILDHDGCLHFRMRPRTDSTG